MASPQHKRITPENQEERLQRFLMSCVRDPLRFVEKSYPWGEPGRLMDDAGPDPWQKRLLEDLGHALTHGWVMNSGVRKDCSSGIFIAVRSGHGIGKSALMAWLDQWFISTHPNPQIVTTANTKEQLTSKTWREQAVWHEMLLNRHHLEYTATRYIHKAGPKTWFSSAIPWSERNPQAFAGTHERYVLVKFDEASEIPDIIWETTEGAMTDSRGIKIWIVFGNPTQASGRFADCFGKARHRWITYEIDARDSLRTDHALFALWEQEYGEDSDFFRVRVKGQLPRTGTMQLIGLEAVERAMAKEHPQDVFSYAPKVLGVDVARFGDDRSVIIRRQGLQAFGLRKFSGLDLMRFASIVAEEIREWSPDEVFVDAVGIGAGVVDRLHQLGYRNVTGVSWGEPASDDKAYYNLRAECWCRLADWIKSGGRLPNDQELRDDLTGPQYGFDNKERKQLERKEDMKKRGLPSPDAGDAIAMTFAQYVEASDDRVATLLKQMATQKTASPLDRSRGKIFRQPPAADIPPIPRGGLRV